MSQNPVEDNAVTRFILGLAVIFGMMIGGGIAGAASQSLNFPYAGWVGVTIGALLVFLAFSVIYGRYDASYRADQ